MEQNKEKTKKDKFYDFVSKHRAKIAGTLGVIGGCFLGWFYTKEANVNYHNLGNAFKYGFKEDDSVIITDEYDIEYEGEKHKGFSIMDKDPIDS